MQRVDFQRKKSIFASAAKVGTEIALYMGRRKNPARGNKQLPDGAVCTIIPEGRKHERRKNKNSFQGHFESKSGTDHFHSDLIGLCQQYGGRLYKYGGEVGRHCGGCYRYGGVCLFHCRDARPDAGRHTGRFSEEKACADWGSVFENVHVSVLKQLRHARQCEFCGCKSGSRHRLVLRGHCASGCCGHDDGQKGYGYHLCHPFPGDRLF